MLTRITSFAVLIFSIVFTSCSTGNPGRAYEIGLLNLDGYAPTSTQSATPNQHLVITSEAAFAARFAPANTDTGLRKPQFSGQMVVAVPNKNEPGSQVIFDRATVSGSTLNVYYRLGTNTSASGAYVLATVPKSGNVKQAKFFNGDTEVSNVDLTQ